jgi:hypothetical protein
MGAIHFEYPGGQIRSLLSLTSYLSSGEYRDRYLGLRIPRTNIQSAQLKKTRDFACALAAQVQAMGPSAVDEQARTTVAPHSTA